MLDPSIRSGDGSDGGGDQCDPRIDVLATRRDPELESSKYAEMLVKGCQVTPSIVVVVVVV